MALLPMAMYGLEVPPGDIAIMAHADIPAAFRVTMAAIDPSAEPEGEGEELVRPRATLKVLRLPLGEDYDDSEDSEDDEDDEMGIEDMDAQFGESEDSEEDESDDEDVNGGPSDPTKSKKARREAAIKKLLEAEGMDLDDDDDDDDDDVEDGKPNGINGITKSKKARGKMPKLDEDDDDSDLDDDDDDEGGEVEEFVLCTLDPNKAFQQPLDITFGEDERVWFKVSGTHTIYLTGNYVEPAHDPSGMFDPDSDAEEEYDLSPDEDELDILEDESDDLDDLEDPRITELQDDEEDIPALVKTEVKKIVPKPAAGKNKRPALDSADEDEAEAVAAGLDEMIAQEAKLDQPTLNGEQKLSKRQMKKLKKNNGAAATAPVVAKVEEVKVDVEAPASNKSDKKVSFAAQLEQGPTPTKDSKPGEKKDDKSKASLGVKKVQGVTVDDRKLGTGQAAKNGDRVSMRYIGKLQSDNKVFDQNKKGKPFSFKLGAGEVIKGMEIGVQGLQAGGERRITIPANLAYGNKRNGDIPANSTLIFDIKMLEINKGK